MFIWKITGVFSGNTRKSPQRKSYWVRAHNAAYAKNRVSGLLRNAERFYKPLKVKKVPPGQTLIT
jgi:hypothetical protein